MVSLLAAGYQKPAGRLQWPRRPPWRGQKLTSDDTDALGPEWLADLYAAVSRAAPGIPWREFLNMPLAAATHLAAAAHRANGGKTERPMDWASALDSIQ